MSVKGVCQEGVSGGWLSNALGGGGVPSIFVWEHQF